MQHKTPVILGALVLVVLIILAVYLSTHAKPAFAPASTQTSSSNSEATGNATVGASGKSIIVTYTDNGFSPETVTIAEGTTVTWTNTSSEKMWVASGNHPNHTLYDGTSTNQHCVNGVPDSTSVFDECTAIPTGGSYSFTFDKVGTWTYHNHVDASHMGTVVVTAGQDVQATLNANVTPN